MFALQIIRQFCLLFLSMFLASIAIAQDVTINITGPGGNARYIQAGQTRQMPVGVKVGQTVRWQNQNTNRQHTATAETSTGALLFESGTLSTNGSFGDVTMTRDIFLRAGGTSGGMVTIEYFCDFHSSMVSHLVLCDHDDGDDDSDGESQFGLRSLGDLGTESAAGGTSGNPSLSVRKNISSLTPAELTAYRDAWREIQDNGSFELYFPTHLLITLLLLNLIF